MSGYIGIQPVPQATQRREYFTATSGQTTFNTNGYTPNYIDVYMNGVKLSPADFTASNGSDVVLASGATTGDLVQVVSFTPFNVANQTFIGDVNLSSGAYKIGGTTVIDTSRVGNFNTGTVIGTYNTAPSGSPGQLAISRTGSAPYVSWHHEDGTRLGNIQFANASNTLYLSNEMSNGKWNFWNGTTTAAEIDHNGAAYFGGTTQAAATRFVHLGGIKFSNGASTGGEFLSWDNEGATGNQSLIGYWYDGSSYRNRFRVAGDHGETVVNGSGDDVDFRVASDGNQDMLFLDASANKIGIGSQSYNYGSALTVHANDSGGAPTSLFLRNSGTAGGSGATIQAGYTSGYGAQIRFSGNPSSYRMASTTFATVTGDGTTQDNVQISTSGDTIIYNDLGVGHAGNPNHVLDVESSVSGDWVSQIHNTHNSNGFGLKVRAGDNGDVNSFRVAAQNNDILLNVDGAGRATMPKQPAFKAYLQADYAINEGTYYKVPHGGTEFNIGGHYSTSNTKFTAPVAGTYFFYATVIIEGFGTSENFRMTMQIRRNGESSNKKGLASGASANSVHDDNEAQVSGLIYLNANDYVEHWVSKVGGTDSAGNIWGSTTSLPWTSFGGYLVG